MVTDTGPPVFFCRGGHIRMELTSKNIIKGLCWDEKSMFLSMLAHTIIYPRWLKIWSVYSSGKRKPWGMLVATPGQVS